MWSMLSGKCRFQDGCWATVLGRHITPEATEELKVGEFSHADAGQMHLYCNYAREHWTLPDENPPVGLILCAQKDAAVAHYALDGLPNKILAAEYRTALPDEQTLTAELDRTRELLERRRRHKELGP